MAFSCVLGLGNDRGHVDGAKTGFHPEVKSKACIYISFSTSARPMPLGEILIELGTLFPDFNGLQRCLPGIQTKETWVLVLYVCQFGSGMDYFTANYVAFDIKPSASIPTRDYPIMTHDTRDIVKIHDLPPFPATTDSRSLRFSRPALPRKSAHETCRATRINLLVRAEPTLACLRGGEARSFREQEIIIVDLMVIHP